MDLETYASVRGWPPIPEDPNDVLTAVSQGQLEVDRGDLLLYLWARSAGAE